MKRNQGTLKNYPTKDRQIFWANEPKKINNQLLIR